MGLVEHAAREMRLAGLYDEDGDYGGMMPAAVMKLIKVFASSGHSGFSAEMCLEIFNKLARYKTLTPITSNPDEWRDVSSLGGQDGEPLWQNKRDSKLFSTDGGKTYWDVSNHDNPK